jgi:hypothetical protein
MKNQSIQWEYIHLQEINQEVNTIIKESNDREFIIRSLNVIGIEKETKFKLKDVEVIREASIHPFASFRVNNKFFYVHSDSIIDEQLKRSLTNDF